MRFAGGVSERVIEKRRARWVPCLDDVQRTAHAQGRDAGSFDVTSDQSHGLMADRSDRDKQGDLSFFRQQAFSELRGEFISHAP